MHDLQIAFEKLDKVSFPGSVQKIYELIKSHQNRICFVKDHYGIRNIVFLTAGEEIAKLFEYPYFAFFTDLEPKTEMIKIHYSPEEIYEATKKFLETTNETLYVGIGFKENEITDDDYFEILYLMEETKCNIIDAIVSLRRFPDWYDRVSEYPYYLMKEKELLDNLQQKEKQFLLSYKQTLLEKLHNIVEKNNEEAFNKITKEINAINKQLASYSNN